MRNPIVTMKQDMPVVRVISGQASWLPAPILKDVRNLFRFVVPLALIFFAKTVFPAERTPAELYQSACAACHGGNGAGRPQIEVGFDLEIPDFRECSFASREPDGDWFAVVHAGGPVRAFDRRMPAFGEALTDEQINMILQHVRTFCTNDNWPRGDLNLPKALFTEKAFPEDEAIVITTINAQGKGAVLSKFVYEKRFGPRSQVEISVPIGLIEQSEGGWDAGIGDIALGLKHNFYHNFDTGTIVSVGAETILPTGDKDNGFGKGSTVFEPFLTYGQILPADSFIQLHAFAEFPFKKGLENEVAIRAAFGRTWSSGRFGRSWTPILEVMAARELTSGADIDWDLVPEVQFSLNQRQHILANIGVRIPINNSSERDMQILFYILWDWFDGDFFDGW